MLDGNCRATRIVSCESGPEGIERIQQVDLWETDKFDKFAWEDSFFMIPDAGMGRVLSALRRSMGQIAKGDHVPVIWRKGCDVQEELGVSADGYWNPISRAVESGLVVKVDQHGMPGRRKMLVAKMPAESEFHAIARAKGAVERYLQKNPAVPRWVLRALRTELDHQVAAASVVTRQGRCPENVAARIGESLMCRGSTSGEQSLDLCQSEVPTYKEQVSYVDSREEEARKPKRSAQKEGSSFKPPSPPPKEEEIVEEKTIESTEAPKRCEALRAFLSDLAARCGLVAKESTLEMIAEAYDDAVGDSETLRHELRAKVVRLADSGFSGAQVAGYLLEDCPLPRPTSEQPEVSELESDLFDYEEVAQEERVSWGEIEEVEDFEAVRRVLKDEKVSSHNYESWFGKGAMLCVEFGEAVIVVVRDEFLKAWVEDNYLDLLEDTIEEVLGEERDVVIQIREAYVVDAPGLEKAAYQARL